VFPLHSLAQDELSGGVLISVSLYDNLDFLAPDPPECASGAARNLK
jgi:hypothetical protein